MASYLITGASRGYGLALTRELAGLPATEVGTIFAGARNSSEELQNLQSTHGRRVRIVELDVVNKTSIETAVGKVEEGLGGKGLDVLINNAGICHFETEGVQAADKLQESFNINVMGVHWVTQAFLPLLREGSLKKVVNIGTTLASISLAPNMHQIPAPSYKVSKAAMHALTVQYALDFDKEGFTFMSLSPGWMKTDLGGGEMADLTAEQGAKASVKIIQRPGRDYNGKLPKIQVDGWENSLHKYDGTCGPW